MLQNSNSAIINLAQRLVAVQRQLDDLHVQFVSRFGDTPPDGDKNGLRERFHGKERELVEHQGVLMSAIANLKATTPTEAAIQLRVLSRWVLMMSEDYCHDLEQGSKRLLYSTLDVVEAAAGIGREDFGGDHFAPHECNPWCTDEPSESDPEAPGLVAA